MWNAGGKTAGATELLRLAELAEVLGYRVGVALGDGFAALAADAAAAGLVHLAAELHFDLLDSPTTAAWMRSASRGSLE